MPAPDYTPRVAAPAGPSVTINPLQPPSLAGREAGAAALGRLGETVVQVAAHVQRAQAETDASLASADFWTGLNDLKKKYVVDPDYRNAPGKFRQDVADLTREQSERIGDNALRARAINDWSRSTIAAGNQVGAAALTRELKVNLDHDDLRERQDVTDATGASSAAERQAAIERRLYATRSLADAGWIDAAQHQARNARFLTALDKADAGVAIARDPGQAVVALNDPQKFPALDPATRDDLIAHGQEAERRNAIAAQDAAELQGWTLARTGKLDQDWLAANADRMSGGVYARLAATMATRGPPPGMAPTPSPTMFAALLDRAVDDPRGATRDAADAYRAGSITRDHFNRIYDTGAQFGDDAEQRPWALDARRDLIEQLRPTDEKSQAQGQALHDASHAFDDWLAGQPDATSAAGRDQVAQLVGQFGGAAVKADRLALPVPDFITAPRDKIDGAALATAADRLRAAHADFEVSDQDLVSEVDKMRAWQDTIRRDPPAGS